MPLFSLNSTIKKIEIRSYKIESEKHKNNQKYRLSLYN